MERLSEPNPITVHAIAGFDPNSDPSTGHALGSSRRFNPTTDHVALGFSTGFVAMLLRAPIKTLILLLSMLLQAPVQTLILLPAMLWALVDALILLLIMLL